MIPGQNYDFKVSALNDYGYSDYSELITLLAAYIPDPPLDVETIMDSANNRVYVSWFQDSDNGSPVTSYSVYVKISGAETYEQESVDCDGTNADVISNLSCFISLTTLTAAPFSLVGGDSVWVRVIATN